MARGGRLAAAMKNRLRPLRAERGWSQADLADQLGVSRQTVNAIENEKYDPSLPLAFKIARTFGLPIETIFDDGGPSRVGGDAVVGDATRRKRSPQ